MIEPKQLRDYVMVPLVHLLTPWNEVQAVELLMGTCMQESECGKYLHQTDGGPALGIMQMEPDTERLVWKWVQSTPFKDAVTPLVMPGLDRTQQLVGNLYYSVAMARMLYASIPTSLPAAGDINGQAAYYKQHYNSPLGAATVQQYVDNWHRLQPLLT